MRNVGVYRRAADMKKAVGDLTELRRKAAELRVADGAGSFNSAVLEVLEAENLVDLALVTAVAALNRTESRGAHSREDYPGRDDENWLKHSLASLDDDEVRIGYKDVDLSRWEPKPRVY